MTPRPTETKKIAAMLEEGGESPTDLAKEVIETLDDMRAQRSGFTIITEVGSPEGGFHFNTFGPFSTQNQAAKAVERGLVPEVQMGAPWRWARSYSEGYLRARRKRVDADVPDAVPVIDVKGRLRPGDPHIDNIDQMWVLNRKTMQWDAVPLGRRKR